MWPAWPSRFGPFQVRRSRTLRSWLLSRSFNEKLVVARVVKIQYEQKFREHVFLGKESFADFEGIIRSGL